MRDDMDKVIVERPRRGGGMKYPRGAARWTRATFDELPRREAMKLRWSPDLKCLNENLAPLHRFLQSRCGRPWDEVYSEIAQRINPSSAVQLHVLQHLFQDVCSHATIRNGVVCDSRGRPPWGWPRFYVHPVTRLLCAHVSTGRWRRRGRRPHHVDVIRKDDRHQYRRIDGIWYEITLAPVPVDPTLAWDMVHRKTANLLSERERTFIGGAWCYACGKRQLNKKQIRRLPKPA